MHKNLGAETIKMELKEIALKIKILFSVTDFEMLPEKIMQIIMSAEHEKIFDAYVDIVGDLQIDYMQKIYQFWLAKRGKSVEQQDYTPESLAILTASIMNTKDGDTVYDACAGSGALTIAAWKINKNLQFVCHEFDEQCIPILLFNLAIRRIKAVVVYGDVLNDEVVQAWEIVPSSKYSTVKPLRGYELGLYDACISNPPYNLRCGINQSEDIVDGISASSFANSNYLFLFHVLSHLKPGGRASFILPCGVMSNGTEIDIRRYLIKKRLLKAVIKNPSKMFESTDIPTCIFLCEKSNPNGDLVVIDGSKIAQSEIREQRGEGDAAHFNRIYKKTFAIYTADGVEKIKDAIKGSKKYPTFAQIVNDENLSTNDYIFSPARYIIQEWEDIKHRPFENIVDDIRRIQHEKNAVKITMNETLVRKLGYQDLLEAFTQASAITQKINETTLKLLKLEPVEVEAYFRTSKNAGEIKIENVNKKGISSLFPFFLTMWRQHIYYLNERENELLGELRDALLPRLMNGELDLHAAPASPLSFNDSGQPEGRQRT